MKKNIKPKSAKIRALTIAAVILCFLSAYHMQSSYAQNSSPDMSLWSVHLYSSRPTNGTTTDLNADFSPFEIVQLNANVTCQGEPRANFPVAFKIVGPDSSLHPTTVIRTSVTDQNGEATTAFRIPANSNPENPVLGSWQAICTMATINQTLRDNTTFTVSLPIIVQGIKLLDQNGTEENNFSTGQTVRVQINVQNLRTQPINANIEMKVTDSDGAKTSQINLQNQKLESASNIVEGEFLMPENASSGQATIDIRVFSFIDGQAVQISEPATATMGIEKHAGPNAVITEAHLSSSNQLTKGQPLTVTMTASNKGSKTENVIISVYYDQNLAGSITAELPPQQQKTLTYIWNTTNISPGTYRITAYIEAVGVAAGTVTLTAAQTASPPEQTVSLFVLTLFITGLATFTLLLSFLRKKGTHPLSKNIARNKIQNQPSQAASQAHLSSVLTVPPKPTTKEKIPQKASLIPRTNASATTALHALPNPTAKTTKPVITQNQISHGALKPTPVLRSIESTLSPSGKIAVTAGKVDAPKTALKTEEKQLSTNAKILIQTTNSQTKATKNDICAEKEEMEKLKNRLSKKPNEEAESAFSHEGTSARAEKNEEKDEEYTVIFFKK